jgi:hypothetical protein
VLPKENHEDEVNRITHEEVLRRVEEKRTIVIPLRGRRGKCIGKILGHISLLETVMEGKMDGKIYGGRLSVEYIGRIKKGV